MMWIVLQLRYISLKEQTVHTEYLTTYYKEPGVFWYKHITRTLQHFRSLLPILSGRVPI